MRYYYKQNGTENYLSLKSPLSDTSGYTEITEEEFNTAQQPPTPTEEELAEQARLNEIAHCKAMLAKTDYIAIKHSEGWITDEDYAETRALRQSYRDRINELEQERG